MKKKAYIYIFTVITIAFLSVIFYFIYAQTYMGTRVASFRKRKIQADYMAESVINLVFAKENFMKELEDYYFSMDKGRLCKDLKINMNIDEVKIDGIELTMVRSGEFSILVRTDYKKIKSKFSSMGTFINDCYRKENGICNSSNTKNDELEKIINGFEKIKTGNFENAGKLIIINGDYKMKKEGSSIKIYEEIIDVNGIEQEIVKTLINEKDVIYQESGSLEIAENINMNNLFIINAKIFSSNINNEGIIYLDRNSQVENNIKVEGYLLDPFDRARGISVKLNNNIIKKYGKILPEYFKLLINNLINKGD